LSFWGEAASSRFKVFIDALCLKPSAVIPSSCFSKLRRNRVTERISKGSAKNTQENKE